MLTINDAVAMVDAGVDQMVCVDDEATVSGTIMTVGGDTPTGTGLTTGAGTLNDMGDGTATYMAVAGDIATDVVLTYTSADLNGCGVVSDDVMLTINDAVATVAAERTRRSASTTRPR